MYLPSAARFGETVIAADPPNRTAVWFSHTVLLSLLQGSQFDHGPALSSFDEWCDKNFLDFNVAKTKELIMDFKKDSGDPKCSVIHTW